MVHEKCGPSLFSNQLPSQKQTRSQPLVCQIVCQFVFKLLHQDNVYRAGGLGLHCFCRSLARNRCGELCLVNSRLCAVSECEVETKGAAGDGMQCYGLGRGAERIRSCPVSGADPRTTDGLSRYKYVSFEIHAHLELHSISIGKTQLLQHVLQALEGLRMFASSDCPLAIGA